MPLKYLDEFRDPAAARAIVARIGQTWDGPPVRIMEVCGTHTMAIAKSGIRQLLLGRVALISGPGCPVCVTPTSYLDAAITLGRERNILLATFGDMVRVPGTRSSLEQEKGRGVDVRTVYSPLDAVALAWKGSGLPGSGIRDDSSRYCRRHRDRGLKRGEKLLRPLLRANDPRGDEPPGLGPRGGN